MTEEEFVYKYAPAIRYYYKSNDKGLMDELRTDILSLQKETWDQACKALLDELNAEREDEAQYTYYPPFNPEK